MSYGIYKIMIGGLPYVGKSSNIEQRFLRHKSAFEAGTQAAKLQAAYDKYKDAEMSILEHTYVDKDLLARKEVFWIKKLNSINNGWNTRGDSSADKVYTWEEQQILAAFIMILDKVPDTDICVETGLTPKMLQTIRQGTNYGWLALEFPKEYNQMRVYTKPTGYSKYYKNF
jgi:hypothetical protein